MRLNRLVLEYDHLLVCGPVFPHEVVGFSGGNKYFFPGIAGADIINFTHWLGALDHLLRDDRHQGHARAPGDRPGRGLHPPPAQRPVLGGHPRGRGRRLPAASPEAAWSAAADLSAQRHIVWNDRPWKQVLSVLPAMYDELWVGAKGMYKTEPAIADGGEVIIYAPHLHEVERGARQADPSRSATTCATTSSPAGTSSSTCPGACWPTPPTSRAAGTYEGGVERPRIQVTLATGISEERCRALNLGYRDPRSIAPEHSPAARARACCWCPRPASTCTACAPASAEPHPERARCERPPHEVGAGAIGRATHSGLTVATGVEKNSNQRFRAGLG